MALPAGQHIETPLIPGACTSGAFCDTKHDAEAGSLELVAQMSGSAASKELHHVAVESLPIDIRS